MIDSNETDDTKAIFDGWWQVSDADHLEIVCAKIEIDAEAMFREFLKIDPSDVVTVTPMSIFPCYGNRAICEIDNRLSSYEVHQIPEWQAWMDYKRIVLE